ncbi:MAG: abortive infection system antitoxin AbiGi family protein [Phycisphaerae bacterium]|jgi:hypothetical protein
MTIEQDISPGTVSKILWHFTGGPKWNKKRKKQNVSPKPANMAYKNLISIMRTKELRLGSYKEVVRAILPKRRKFNLKTKKHETHLNVPIDIESSSICCLSDIPAPHLRYHAYRYGKFAIGFHRDAIIQAGFNPVFYTLHDTPIIRSIYRGFSFLDYADPNMIRNATYEIASEVSDYDYINIDTYIDDIEEETDSFEMAISKIKKNLENFVAFVKTFDRDEFGTIYCEREWRSTKSYGFDFNDVALIVLPRIVGEFQYFEHFTEKVAPNLKLPRKIPIVPWDDLVEH